VVEDVACYSGFRARTSHLGSLGLGDVDHTNEPTPSSSSQLGLYDLTNRQLQMTVASARANKDQKFLDVAFHYKGEVDFEDVSELQKSALYDVRVGAQVMIFRYDEKFAAEWASGIKTTSYILLIVPSTVRPEDFSTIRQALSKGAKIVGGGSGPP